MHESECGSMGGFPDIVVLSSRGGWHSGTVGNRNAAAYRLVQLSCQHCGYLPTEKAVEGGGYSADKYMVGPEGGQVLVNETIRQIKALWE